ncbi:DNA-3-methyladenine glycosylase [soil metagenome]
MDHLCQNDAVLAEVITQVGVCTIEPHRNQYQELVSSIIGQQLSVKAAETIEKRFKDVFGGFIPAPDEFIRTDEDSLRAAGVSRQKITYIRDLAEHIIDGRLELNQLPSQTDEEVEQTLTAVKGIGQWTAHMFLMFSLGRTDVLPVGDLGIRVGIQKLYGLEHKPTPDEVQKVAEIGRWKPYQSFAAWYVWQFLKL